MKARPALVYTTLRLLAFLVPFGLMMLLPPLRELYWLAAIFAALIGLSLSIIFLRRPLAEATSGLPGKRLREGVAHGEADAASEDAVLDAAAEPNASPAPIADTDSRPTAQ